MPTTRKRANSLKDSPESTAKKRGAAKNTSSSPNKKSKLEKDQKTIEETIDNAEDAVEEEEAIEKQINEAEKNGDDERVRELQAREEAVKKREQDIKKREDAVAAREKSLNEQNEDQNAFVKTNEESVIDNEREATVPSSITEKGIIYFFFRSRVNVEDPQGVEDIARSYIVLRPLPLGAKIGEGPLEDSGDARLLALPKKVLPKSAKDRFLVFVEKPKASVKDLKEQFSSSEYATKTVGTSHTPAATPFAEGIYAITKTGRESHLAYHITAPEIGEVQKEFGLHENGSYVVSVKNPETPAPGNAGLPNPAKYPEEVQKKFRGLRWMPLEPEFLDYENSQVLIIGAGMGEMGKALEEQSKDARDDEKDKPEEEMIKLEEEDEQRVEHLKEDDPVFADLGLSSKEYEKMKTKW